MNKKQDTISMPRQLLTSLIEAQVKWEEFNNRLEDFLLSSDSAFLKKMRKARKEHRNGELKFI